MRVSKRGPRYCDIMVSFGLLSWAHQSSILVFGRTDNTTRNGPDKACFTKPLWAFQPKLLAPKQVFFPTKLIHLPSKCVHSCENIFIISWCILDMFFLVVYATACCVGRCIAVCRVGVYIGLPFWTISLGFFQERGTWVIRLIYIYVDRCNANLSSEKTTKVWNFCAFLATSQGINQGV